MFNVIVPVYVLLVLAGVTVKVAAFAFTGANDPAASAKRNPMFADDSKEPCGFIRIDFVLWPDSPEKWPKVIEQQCCQQSAGIGVKRLLISCLAAGNSRRILENNFLGSQSTHNSSAI
jgi:hypothetical protein